MYIFGDTIGPFVFLEFVLLWSSYGIGQTIIFLFDYVFSVLAKKLAGKYICEMTIHIFCVEWDVKPYTHFTSLHCVE